MNNEYYSGRNEAGVTDFIRTNIVALVEAAGGFEKALEWRSSWFMECACGTRRTTSNLALVVVLVERAKTFS